jgi:carnosine N-methyltransferase
MLESPAPDPLCYAAAAAKAWAAQHGPQVNPGDTDKVRYVLKNMMRDWSSEGEGERNESYKPILDELQKLLLLLKVEEKEEEAPQGEKNTTAEHPPHIANNTSNLEEGSLKEEKPRPRPRVLVPGCGLGRLCAELASLGFETLGNEHSYYMLIASAFILNDISRAEQWTIAPWVHNNNNHVNDADQLRPVFIPDIIPSDLIERTAPGLLGMAAGEFTQVFKNPDYKDHFDAVVTCFFIDTAHNIIEYLETLWHCLKPGGYWVNLGPLQWHWADAHTYLPESEQLSIELSMVEVQRVAQRMGFVILKSEIGRRCRYMSDDKSMVGQAYECAMWTAQKPWPT